MIKEKKTDIHINIVFVTFVIIFKYILITCVTCI